MVLMIPGDVVTFLLMSLMHKNFNFDDILFTFPLIITFLKTTEIQGHENLDVFICI